ncbi:DUF421 domain-containing protein [Psychrobacter sp. FDAARGOS_221]|uniref:DUF421 domain-containing protein n=1 Tax=Psychrobacter sp. FDAARGOS_221 TaxID=1975705 RepID=UPI000BB579FB|nr:YetF domain-containing protein [Psychrobacter sp. FDAARGOS_221]PNK60213.1 DUF421 domain-containing protein [Psychrobacter sp. FDAARGOS_221]
MENIFFNSWETLFRIIIASVAVYVCIVLFHKVSGKRSSSQLNNFDWVVTVMIGSIGASTIVLSNVPIIEGMASIVTLLLLQFLVTQYSTVSPEFASFILSEPRVVFYQGQFLPEAMRKERLTRQEIECAMRSEGIHDFDEVAAVIFESDAKLTVVAKRDEQQRYDEEGNIRPSDTLNPLT